MAWQRVGNELRCIEHGETFALGRRCTACPAPVPGRSDRRRRKKLEPSPSSELSAAADFCDHPLATREGRIEAAIRLFEEVASKGSLGQPEMNALKECRMLLELLETLSGQAATEGKLAELIESNAALLERMENAGSGETVEPPLVEAN